jgi:hypothetical protein
VDLGDLHVAGWFGVGAAGLDVVGGGVAVLVGDDGVVAVVGEGEALDFRCRGAVPARVLDGGDPVVAVVAESGGVEVRVLDRGQVVVGVTDQQLQAGGYYFVPPLTKANDKASWRLPTPPVGG